MALRAFAISRGDALRRDAARPRPADAHARASREHRIAEVRVDPQGHHDDVNRGSWSNRSARARSLSFGRSVKLKSMALSAAASLGLASPIARMTSSASSGSRLLMMLAMRERPSRLASNRPSAVLERRAQSFLDSSAAGGVKDVRRGESAKRRPARTLTCSALTIFPASGGSSREKKDDVAVAGRSAVRKAMIALSGARASASQTSISPVSPGEIEQLVYLRRGERFAQQKARLACIAGEMVACRPRSLRRIPRPTGPQVEGATAPSAAAARASVRKSG